MSSGNQVPPSNKKDPKELPEKKKDQPSSKESWQGVEELGGPKGLEPTRYGDWESNGRCSDF